MTSSTRNRTNELPAPAQRADELPTVGRLGTAQARWNDYQGTAAADAIALLGSRSLYEIADLDRRRSTILGIDASLPTPPEPVLVHAVDRTIEPDGSARAAGELGVTAFRLSPSTQVDQLLHEAFERVSIRLVFTMATGRALRVDAHVERNRNDKNGHGRALLNDRARNSPRTDRRAEHAARPSCRARSTTVVQSTHKPTPVRSTANRPSGPDDSRRPYSELRRAPAGCRDHDSVSRRLRTTQNSLPSGSARTRRLCSPRWPTSPQL